MFSYMVLWFSHAGSQRLALISFCSQGWPGTLTLSEDPQVLVSQVYTILLVCHYHITLSAITLPAKAHLWMPHSCDAL